MKLFPYAKTRVLAGLALHQDRFCMVRLKQYKQTKMIDAFAVLDAPDKWLIEGKISRIEETVNVIQSLAKSLGKEPYCVAIALPASQMIQKRIKLAAYLNDTERLTHISENLSHYLPGLNESLYFDFVRITTSDQEDECLLVAARRLQVDGYVSLLEQAGLKTVIVDVDIYALARALSITLVNEVTVVLDMDESVAQLLLFKRREIKSVHQVFMNDHFIQQLKRGLQLFGAMTQPIKIEKIIFVGKQKRLTALRKKLEDELAISVEPTRVFDHVMVSEEIKQHELMLNESELLTAFGLAMRAFPSC